MSEEQTQRYQITARIYAGFVNILNDPAIRGAIRSDEYLFAAYMTAIHPMVTAIFNDRDLYKSTDREIDDLSDIRDIFLETWKETKSATEALSDRDGALKMLNELKKHIGSQLTAAYGSVFISYTQVYRRLNKTNNEVNRALTVLMSAILAYTEEDGGSAFDNNLNKLSGLVNLTIAEANLIRISALQAIDMGVSTFFRYFEQSVTRSDLIERIAYQLVFDVDLDNKERGVRARSDEAYAALKLETSKPLAFGLVSYNAYQSKRISQLSSFWLNTLFKEYTSFEGLIDELVSEAKIRDTSSSTLARIDDKDKAILNRLLARIDEDPTLGKGVNLLCYGPHRFDKRSVLVEFLTSRDKKLVDTVFELKTKAPASQDLPSVAWIAQTWIALQCKGTDDRFVLIIDEAENVLTRGVNRNSLMYDIFGEDMTKRGEKTELNSDEILLKSGTLTLWLTNHASDLTPEVIGRFMAHFEVKAGTRADRKDAVLKIANELKLSDEMIAQLAKYRELGPNQVRSASNLVKLLDEPAATVEKQMLSLVEASQKALERADQEEIRESVTKYDLSLLNLSGRFGIDKIVKALAKKPSGTLCFYGLPGTGKTQLAEHLAVAIDKPLIIKRASDIFSMWVGEAEKNVKKMFEEGKNEDAVILLDEADSFLRDRRMARAAHEVTTVNELLTRMERYTGVFICATNLFEHLDQAALRRFTFKLQFNSLNEHQRIRMFENEVGVKMTHDEKDPYFMRLMGMRYLTPGDFAAVKRQALIFDETLSAEDWLSQLELEIKAKMQETDTGFAADPHQTLKSR